MGPSVSDLPKILLIVEGERREADFFHALAEQCGIPVAFYAVGGNISMLYGMMEKEGFTCNVKDLLLERVRDGQDRQILEQNYAETYLIFDCDAQHTQDKREHGTFSDKEIAAHVMARVRKMAEQLNNETDPTRGKLYVNYPSIESYRDADACYDESYRDARVALSDLRRYKALTGRRRLASKRLDSFTRGDFESLMRMNVHKLNAMLGDGWGPCAYAEYRERSEQTTIAGREAASMQEGFVEVLNTSLFLPLDYFGAERFNMLFPRG